MRKATWSQRFFNGPEGEEVWAGIFRRSPISVWILSDPKGMLSRIDPDTNTVIAEIARRLAALMPLRVSARCG